MRTLKYVPHPKRRPGGITFDQFCDIIREDQKADLIDGVIYMASPESLEANELFVWLLGLVFDYVDEFNLGRVFGSRVAFKLAETNGPEPDIAFVHKGQEHRMEYGRIIGPPDFAIEIVSPESVERDYEDKRLLYERHGASEYWIVDEHEKKVTAYRADRRGKFVEVRQPGGELKSSVIDQFWIRPEWLWMEPRPKKLGCLKKIVARRTR